MTGARYQIAVDGQPRSNRDDRAIAIEAAEYLKYKNPDAEVIVYDRVSRDNLDENGSGDRNVKRRPVATS